MVLANATTVALLTDTLIVQVEVAWILAAYKETMRLTLSLVVTNRATAEVVASVCATTLPVSVATLTMFGAAILTS